MSPRPAKPGVKRWNQGSGHGYSIDGQRAIGVTTALKALPKELTRWSARTVAAYVAGNPDNVMQMLRSGGQAPTVDFLSGLPFQKRNEAAVRGTAVHKLAEQAVKGDEIDVPEHLVGYVESYMRFLDDFNPTSVHEELVVASRAHCYAGTLDSIQDIPGLGRALVDYKTSNGIYGEAALQVAAYRYADCFLDTEGNERPMIPVDATYVLHIQHDGYALYPLDANEDAFETFLSVLKVYRRAIQQVRGTKKLDSLIGQPIEPPLGSAA